MRREVQTVLLCEDKQHQAFVLRFLERMGQLTPKSKRRLRIERAPHGRGSAEGFVRTRFPVELVEYRRRKNRMSIALIVMLDGDAAGVDRRLADLDAACEERGVPGRQRDEDVFVVVPTWQIETWFAYLDGQTIDEATNGYPRLRNERDCRRHVEVLADMCRSGQLREPIPHSLASACAQYSRWSESSRN